MASCSDCGTSFEVSEDVKKKYPGWTPTRCRDCHGGRRGSGSRASARRRPSAAQRAPEDTPTDGVFTDGSATPNPGPGGWGAVWVVEGKVQAEASGGHPDTTNNRMELQALIEGVRLVPTGTAAVLWSDSNLAVRTVNEWAAGWKARGWKRKTGPVENLDLVEELYELLQSRPELEVRWIKAHVGHTWNEYADRLAGAANPANA